MKSIISLISIIIFLFSSHLFSQSAGDLDPTFGNNGIVLTAANGSDSYCYDLATQTDGKIIAVGYSQEPRHGALVRYKTNGSIDSLFGNNGMIKEIVGAYSEIFFVLVDKNNKIIVGGTTQSVYPSSTGFLLMRYNDNGILDPTFGNNGIVITSITNNGIEEYRGLALTPDGKIVGVGYVNQSIVVLRYDSLGVLDNSFGSGGMTSIGNINEMPTEVLVQPDGKIIVIGSYIGFIMYRLNTNGQLDNSFGTNGRIYTSFSNGEANASSGTIQNDGKILIGGGNNAQFTIARYDTNGTLDSSFGTDGIAVKSIGINSTIKDIVMQIDGKIVATGTSYTNTTPDLKFTTVRFNSNGIVDTSFGNQGVVITEFGGTVSYSEAVKIQDDSQILIGGTAYFSSVPDNIFALCRYYWQSPHFIALSSPNGGEDWLIGTTQQIEWTSSGVSNLKIEYSTNNGLSWITIENLYPSSSGSYSWDIPPYPTNQCLVKLSDANDLNVYDISDGAFSLVTPIPFWQFSGLGGESVTAVEGDLLGNVYAGSNQTGLYRSTDNGGNWNLVNTGSSGAVKAIKVNPAGEIFASYEDKLRYSTDNGISWQLSSTIYNGITSIESRSPGFVLVGHGGGLERSTNYGNNWEHISLGGSVACLVYDKNGRLFVGVFDSGINETYVIRSTNDGNSWTELTGIPRNSGIIRAITFLNDLIFVGTTDSGMYRSSDDGVSWIKINDGLTALQVNDLITDSDQNLYAGINGGIFKSDNYGTSWGNVSWGLNSTQIEDLGKDTYGYLYAGIWSYGGMYRSIQPVGSSFLSLLVPNGGEEWIAGTQEQITWASNNIENVRIEYSLDNELSWIQIAASVSGNLGAYNWTVPGTISTCKIKITDISNVLLYDVSDSVFYITNPLDVADDSFAPTEYSLSQCHPNPFNSSTSIEYQIPFQSNVSLKLYDVLGNEVATLVEEYKTVGRFEVVFTDNNLTSGVYFYRLQAGNFVQTKKMILMK